jgi:glucosamine--fructose-6-phosphate aminotransferase (isomerizing)
MTLHDEIAEQPAVARRFLAAQTDVIERIADGLRAQPVRRVVIAERGSSDHAAPYARYVFAIRHGLSVGLGTHTIISAYGIVLDLADTSVIGISQSRASPDIVATLSAARA